MCECVPSPPIFDIGLPPDPSLIWHLISDEIFQGSEDCTWDPFVSITDETVTTRHDSKTVDAEKGEAKLPLLICALAAVLLLFILVTLLAIRFRRRSLQEKTRKKKTPSADHILTATDNTWSYNSMKTTPHSVHGSLGVLMYGDARNTGSMIFHKNPTPNTIRSYRTGECPLRQSATTIRLNYPGEPPGAYHTLGRHYEEIPSRFGSFAPSPLLTREDWQTSGRNSMRRPPPSSRPPPPPPSQPIRPPEYVVPTDAQRKFHSPGCSDSSLDNELVILPNESPQMKRWDESGGETRSRHSGENGGRESGYGTTPSRQWKTSPASGGRSELLQQPGNLPEGHSMTYV